jgi:Icc-related predicted phosphoesterase
MKILALSDRVVEQIYSETLRTRYPDVDMVLGCGDLPFYYLEYVVSALNVPLLYVHGNHDKPRQYLSDGRVISAAQGCVVLEDRTVCVDGMILAGLGGSRRYTPHGVHQYTESEMATRVARLVPALWRNRLRWGRYLDILVTHSPPLGIHDGQDLPHIGFKSLLWLMRTFRPRYLLHGHTHIYRRDLPRQTQYHDTLVLNVYPYWTITLDDE